MTGEVDRPAEAVPDEGIISRPGVSNRLYWYLDGGYRYALRYKLWAKWSDVRTAGSRAIGSDDFVPGEQLWVKSHYVNAVREFLEFARPRLDGTQELLDVGCGDSLLSYGLLRLPWRKVVGLDIVSADHKDLPNLPERIKAAGLRPPTQSEIERFEHVDYDGEHFPFDDASFDWLFSWSAFEHVANVRQVLSEMKRVLRPNGFAFVQVSPWFHSRTGSHLVDYIAEPWFQLKRTDEEVRARLEQVAVERHGERAFILDHMWPEYLGLNRYSADMFYEDVKATGWTVAKAKLLSNIEELSEAPPEATLSELMVEGTYMVLQPA